MFLRLYMIVDVFSRFVVGWEIHEDERAEHASKSIDRTCLKYGVKRDQLVLHSDNGGPMKGATMLATLQRLGIVRSFSRPSFSDDNPYSEALFRTLKYSACYPSQPFADIAQARQRVQTFVNWYNNEHRQSGINFVTPAQRHSGQDQIILKFASQFTRLLSLQDQIGGKIGQPVTGTDHNKFGLTRQKSTTTAERI